MYQDQRNSSASQSHDQNQHHHYMSLALQLASQGRSSVSPNPMVGCVIVKDGRIVGQGYHQFTGGPHAEIYALNEARELARGAVAYVNLEPCAHYGRTPPCVNALIEAGIAKVFVACRDPNPLVSGRGIELLKCANVAVDEGICNKEATQLNEIFFHYIKHKTPFVFAKWAMSLDGKTITHQEDNRQISGAEVAQLTHQLRHEVDAIIVGANTARTDDPQLTVRLVNENVQKQPLRIILSSDGNLPRGLKIFSNELPGKTIIATTTPINNNAIETLIIPKNAKGKVDLPSLLKILGERHIASVLVEGGMTVHESFMQEKLINKIFVYLSPVIIGNFEKKQNVEIIRRLQMKTDSIFEVKYV